jgi:hypothetical protein
MAEKYAGKKFDDPEKKVDPSVRDVYDAFPKENARRAFQGIANRVIGGTNGTQGPLINIGAALGTTAGFKITNGVSVVINGVVSECIAQDNLPLPDGTLAANTVAKYLICTAAGTSGTVIGPGNVVSKADYDTAALAAAACRLPDLPDGYCALGYVTLQAPEETALAFADGAGFVTGTGGTAGTATYVNLMCMPYNL